MKSYNASDNYVLLYLKYSNIMIKNKKGLLSISYCFVVIASKY